MWNHKEELLKFAKDRKSLKKKLDRVFSLFIRLRDCDKKWIIICPLCWSRIIWNWEQCQNMHFVKREKMGYRYNEENCYAGCKKCNVMLNWNYEKYTLFMIKKFWIEKVESMVYDNKTYKVYDYELDEKIWYYIGECIKLWAEKGIDIRDRFTQKDIKLVLSDN